jgi:polyhydroxyalkanoate synthesis regulator phasin
MSQISDKVKDQVESMTKQINRLEAAGRGLLLKVSEESSRQFEQLAKEGEAQLESGNTLSQQLKNTVQVEGGVKQVAQTLKLAALGLVTKAKSETQNIIDELVKQADEVDSPKSVSKPKAVKKAKAPKTA